MQFSKIIDDYFTANFNEDVVCYFKQGLLATNFKYGPVYINMLSNLEASQPSDFFMMMRKTGGAVTNETIGIRSQVLKRQSVALTFNLYTPADESPLKETDIEAVLDDLFLNIDIYENDQHIYSDQSTPKSSGRVDSSGANVWHDKQLTYRLIYEFF